MKRIYTITDRVTKVTMLVEAVSKTGALRYMAEQTFDCKVASPYDVATILTEGGKIHKSDDPQSDLYPDD